FDENTGETMTLESIGQTSFSVANHFQKPEHPDAPHGRALRLDGYSTWAFQNSYTLPNISKKMAVEIWYATECFNEKSVGLISQLAGGAGFTIKVSPYGKLFYQYYADNQNYFFTSIQSLKTYQWNHIFLQIDLNAKKTQLYVNGELWAEQTLGNHDHLSFANTVMYLGRGNDSPDFQGFLLSAANGALDEVRIFNQTFTPTEINTRFNAIGYLETDLFVDHNIRHAGDHLRPRYHVMPNTSWANESYGLTYYDSTYHLFFQKNPNSPTLYFMHWGHWSSPDLVTWKEERIALAPQPGFSDFGCWSGTTTYDENGVPVIAYTGVDGQKAGIGIAHPLDNQLIKWETLPDNPVIPNPPPNFPNMDFRDPYIWKEGSTYYMIVGSGLQNNGGGILFSYKSQNLTDWETILPIYQNNNVAQSGKFWEMPSFIKTENGDYILIVTPVFNGAPAQTIYWVGSFVDEKFTPYNNLPQPFEHITRNLLSPSFGRDETGSLTYLGIIPEDRDANDQIAAGWRQTFSIPRVARLLEDGRIGHYPHPNLCRLRKNNVHIENREIAEGTNFNLPEIQGDQYEIDMVIVPEPDAQFALQIFKNEAATLLTSIYGDLKTNKLGINRNLSSPYLTAEDNRFATYVFQDTVHLRLFVDHSIVEVFVDNLAVISARVYPGENQKLIDFVVPAGKVKIERLDYWEMGDKEESFQPEICEPEYLPEAFLSGIFESLQPIKRMHLSPNPTHDTLQLNLGEMSEHRLFDMRIYDANGRVFIQNQSFNPTNKLDISKLPNGNYFLLLNNVDGSFVGNFFKQ
ncbi:MAG: GH32 C-terminal domain-containing protein, partial [Saprospiraceae bacterium]|nr:GH32 C-terminal domain-containing protein [Saprospiraceae bacterium]